MFRCSSCFGCADQQGGSTDEESVDIGDSLHVRCDCGVGECSHIVLFGPSGNSTDG